MSTTVLTTLPSSPVSGQTEASSPAAPPAGGDSPPVAPSSSPPDEGGAPPKEIPNDAPDPDLELARKFDQIAKREARARRFDTEAQTKLREAEERAAKLAADHAAFLEDPVAWAIKNGKDPVQIYERMAAPKTEEQKRLDAIQERLDKQEAAEKERAEKAEAESRQAAQHRAMVAFVSETDPEEYPFFTSVYEPAAIPKVIESMLSAPVDADDPDSPSVLEAFKARHGRAPRDEEIRQALEIKAKDYATRIMSRAPKAAPPPGSEGAPSQGAPGLSNQHAANVSSGSPPRAVSRAERMKAAKAALEAEQDG